MALVFVGGATATGFGTGTVTVNLTALSGGAGSAAVAGDIVCALISLGQNNGTTFTDPGFATGGYTAINSSANGSTVRDVRGCCGLKIMGGTPDTSVSTDTVGSAVYGKVLAVQVWRNNNTTTQPDVAITVNNGTGTDTPDTGSVSPVTTGAIVLSMGASSMNAAVTPAAPSGYSNLVTNQKVGTTGSAVAAISSKLWSGSGAEDPGAYSGYSGGSGLCWVGFTLVIRPVTNVIVGMNVPNIAVAAPTMGVGAMWVLPSDVKLGVQYGPNGDDYTGTYAGGGGGGLASRVIGSSVIRRLH